MPFVRSIRLNRSAVPSIAEFPFTLPLLREFTSLDLHPKVTFFIGENGTGKSTLIEALAIAAGFNAEGGSRHFRFASRPSHTNLHRYLTLVRNERRPRDGFFLRAESFYNVATQAERLQLRHYMDRPPGADSAEEERRWLHEFSHGEAFLWLLLHRFGGNGLYILDEPEAALSPTRQLSLLARMHQLLREGSQFIVATHSPIVMAYPDAWIYRFSSNGIRRVNYKETEHYQVTQNFLENPERMLRVLMEDTGDRATPAPT